MIVQRKAKTARALVSFPLDVEETDEGCWMAGKVYDINRPWSDTLESEIEADYERWLAIAQEEAVPKATLEDVVEAINELTDLIIGGE